MLELKSIVRTAAVTVALFGCASALAQTWPSQRVTFLVPFAPGGPGDIAARSLASLVEPVWKQSIVVDNRPGAGGLTGTAVGASAKPDGYTMVFNGNGVVTSKFFVKAMPYDTADLRPILETIGNSFTVVVSPDFPAKTLKDVVAVAKEKPKTINYGTIPFTTQHLDYFLLQRKLGIELTGVPYNGAAPMLPAILRNEIQFYMSVPSGVQSQIEAGKLVPIAVTGANRNERLPNVPTMRELGYDFVAGFEIGLWVPTKTPDSVVNKIQTDLSAAMLTPSFVARMKELSFVVPAQPRAFPDLIAKTVRDYTEVVQQLNIQPQ